MPLSSPARYANCMLSAIVITSLEIVRVAKKSTNAEKAFRVSTVYGLLCDGASRADIVRFAAENWDIKERMAENYIADACANEQDCQLSRQQLLKLSLASDRSANQQAVAVSIRSLSTQSDCRRNCHSTGKTA